MGRGTLGQTQGENIDPCQTLVVETSYNDELLRISHCAENAYLQNLKAPANAGAFLTTKH